MIATARAVRMFYGKDVKVVFIGPCISKKGEAAKTDDVDAALSFRELKYLIDNANIDTSELSKSEFDFPKSGLGALFPLSGGIAPGCRYES